jgi:hypothetical protein
MNLGILGITDDLRSQRFYHGTRADLKPGDLIEPGDLPGVDERDRMTTYVYLTPNLDAAIWGAELAVGEGPGRDILEPIGQIEEALDLTNQKSRGAFRRCHAAPASPCGSRARSRFGWVTSPEALKAMKDGLERLGVEPIDD